MNVNEMYFNLKKDSILKVNISEKGFNFLKNNFEECIINSLKLNQSLYGYCLFHYMDFNEMFDGVLNTLDFDEFFPYGLKVLKEG